MTNRFTPARLTMAASSLLAVTALTACGAGGSDSAANLQLKPAATSASSSTTTSAAPSTSSSTTTSKVAPSTTTKPKAVSRDEARPATTTRTVTQTVTVPFSTTKNYSSALAKGTSKVTTAGVSGAAKLTIKQTLVGGKVTNSVTIDRDVTKQPVAKVITVGTKKAVSTPAPSSGGGSSSGSGSSGSSSSGGGLNLARAAMWDRIAWCESGQRWNLVASNSTGTYHGGLMMTHDAWRIGGGLKFASDANLASRAQQITVANNLYAQLGLKPWSCAHAA